MRHALAIFLLMLAGIAPGPPAAAAAPSDREILLGLIPEENIFLQMKRHRPLGQYLSGKTGIRVRFTVLSRYPHIVTRFAKRKLDGAFFGIYTAVIAEESLDIEPIARSVNMDGLSTAQGYLFVRSGSGIADVRDLRGKRAAFVDQVTATGYMYAIAYLREHGVADVENFFSHVIYTGSHDSAVYTVMSGQADFGAAKGRILEAMAEKDPLIKTELKIIAKSIDLPDNTLYLRKSLPIDVKLKVQQALLDMHNDPEGRKILEHYGSRKFIEAKSADLAPVREMARKARLRIKDLEYEY